MTDLIRTDAGAEVDGRPVPLLNETTRPYWEASLRGQLLVQECGTCSQRQFYPRSICIRCGAVPGWLEAVGTGVVHTFTIVRQSGAAPFSQWAPYPIAMVELDEGPRIMGGVIGCPVEDVHIGMRVQVQFVPLNDEAALPFWRPAD